ASIPLMNPAWTDRRRAAWTPITVRERCSLPIMGPAWRSRDQRPTRRMMRRRIAAARAPPTTFTQSYQWQMAAYGPQQRAVRLTLYIDQRCGDPTSVWYCRDQTVTREAIRIPVKQKEPVFVVVDGRDASSAGSYQLDIELTPPVCGDRVQNEPEEQCDLG